MFEIKIMQIQDKYHNFELGEILYVSLIYEQSFKNRLFILQGQNMNVIVSTAEQLSTKKHSCDKHFLHTFTVC